MALVPFGKGKRDGSGRFVGGGAKGHGRQRGKSTENRATTVGSTRELGEGAGGNGRIVGDRLYDNGRGAKRR